MLPEAVNRTLDGLSSDRFGVIEFGAVIGATHFKVAGELIAEMLVTGVPEDQKLDTLKTKMKTMAGLLPVVQALEIMLAIYADARGLI